MTKHIDNVPAWVRIVVGILAVLNIAYGVMGYFRMDLLFHAGTGIDLTNPLIKDASLEFAARNLAIGLALGFVTIIKGAPEALVILTITRALIEIQTIIISMTHNNINGILLVPIVFLIVEIIIIKTLIGVIKKEEAQQLAK
jgi:hypothetical protein